MKILEQIESLVSGKLSTLKLLIGIVKLEARLAGLSIFPLLLNLSLLLIILMTTWLVGVLLLGYGLLVVFKSFLLASLSVLFLHIILVGILLNYLSFNLKKMSFEKTREYFSTTMGNEHERLEKTDHCETSRDGKEIKVPTG